MPSQPVPDLSDSESTWTLVIGPRGGSFDWRLAELWRCRDLISLFVWRDFVVLYKQTILGPAWYILQPLLTTLIFTVIFGKIAGLSTNGCPPFLFYLAGNVLWSFFSNCLTKTSATFVANASLMGKVYFHRLVIPVSIVFSTLISFAIQLILFLVSWCFYLVAGEVHPDAWIFALPLVIFMLAGYALGGGIIVTALTTRYRDLAMVVTFGVQLLMFVTPVIFPASAVPERFRWVVLLNPLSPIFEVFRSGFFGKGAVTFGQLTASMAGLIGILAIGLTLFSRVEKSSMDTV